jgi:hypothetical protein
MLMLVIAVSAIAPRIFTCVGTSEWSGAEGKMAASIATCSTTNQRITAKICLSVLEDAFCGTNEDTINAKATTNNAELGRVVFPATISRLKSTL